MRLCQLEFYSTSLEESLSFVEAVIGWRRVPFSIGDQIIIEVPDDSPYGISIKSIPATKPSPSVLAYFATVIPLVDLAKKVLDRGGRILQEPKHITGYGQVMVIEGPGSIRLGLFNGI